MIELVLTACLLAKPEVCRDTRIPLAEDVTPFQCMMAASLPAIARWNTEHPEWRVQQWTCRDQKVEKDI